MGVLMIGVDMPKNCEECNFKGECRDYWEKIREAYTRPSWCPLVEVFDKDTNVRSKTEPQIHGIFREGELSDEQLKELKRQVNLFVEYAEKKKTEPQTDDWHDDCNTCRWHDGACTIPCCDYEPKDEPQTDCAWR